MFSFAGETVFDPFASSSTTSLAAKNLGRNSIGYEINKNFEPIIREKLGVDQFDLDDDTKTFLQKTKLETFHLFNQLTYIFSDLHRMDKKVDMKNFNLVQRLIRQKQNAMNSLA